MSIKEKNLKILEEFENLEGKIIVQVNDEIASEISIEKNEDYLSIDIMGVSYLITKCFEQNKKIDIKLIKKVKNGLKVIEFKKVSIESAYEDEHCYTEYNHIYLSIPIDKKEFKVFNFEAAIKEE